MLKETYKKSLLEILENKKLIFWVTGIFFASFIVGLINPDFLINYQNKLISDVLAVKGERIFGVISKIIFTNAWAAILGIASGALLLPSLFLLFFNGYMLGAVVSRAMATVDISQVTMSIIPHAIFEIPAILLSYFLGVSIGMIWFSKGSFHNKLKEMVLKYKKSSVIFISIVLPLLFIAGIIEGLLFTYRTQIFQFRTLFFSVMLLYLFYSMLKTVKFYLSNRNPKMIILLSLILLAALGLWMEAYGLRVKELIESSAIFKMILILLPFTMFMFYLYLENLRYKEEKEKIQLKGAFQQYVSPDIVNEITKNPEKLKLGGEKKEMTIFFSDIRSFSTISERFSPEKLVKTLNEYLSAMTDIILEKRGVVDKYIGDAIMAFWNAPLDEPRHAELACCSAIEMREKLKSLQERWDKEGMDKINIGIGLNTGEAVVGNMGSMQRFDYTVMGDSVNLASRLEGLTKVYGCMIIISESTMEKVKHKFATRQLDFVKVKGKHKPVKIYELMCKTEELNEKDRQFMKEFDKGLNLYMEKRWDDAIRSFEACLKMRHDKSSELFIGRCKEFKENPPKDWDGVYEMKIK